MDILGVLLGVVSFLIILAIVEGIDRI